MLSLAGGDVGEVGGGEGLGDGATVRVPSAFTRFWLRVPAARTAVVRAVKVIVICWFSAMPVALVPSWRPPTSGVWVRGRSGAGDVGSAVPVILSGVTMVVVLTTYAQWRQRVRDRDAVHRVLRGVDREGEGGLAPRRWAPPGLTALSTVSTSEMKSVPGIATYPRSPEVAWGGAVSGFWP